MNIQKRLRDPLCIVESNWPGSQMKFR